MSTSRGFKNWSHIGKRDVNEQTTDLRIDEKKSKITRRYILHCFGVKWRRLTCFASVSISLAKLYSSGFCFFKSVTTLHMIWHVHVINHLSHIMR